MSKGNGIIVSAEPRGRFLEGIISGTPKPGTCMQLQIGTAAIGGRFTYEIYGGASGTVINDGDPREVIILLEDNLQGFSNGTAYVSGTMGRLYVPLPGEEFNMLLKDISGTVAHTHGERLARDNDTGKLVVQTDGTKAADFQLLENITLTVVADVLGYCVKT